MAIIISFSLFFKLHMLVYSLLRYIDLEIITVLEIINYDW